MSRSDRRSTVSTLSSPSSKSTKASFSATRSNAWSYWPRRLLNWAIHASSSTPRWYRPTGIRSFTISVMESAGILFALVSMLHVYMLTFMSTVEFGTAGNAISGGSSFIYNSHLVNCWQFSKIHTHGIRNSVQESMKPIYSDYHYLP